MWQFAFSKSQKIMADVIISLAFVCVTPDFSCLSSYSLILKEEKMGCATIEATKATAERGLDYNDHDPAIYAVQDTWCLASRSRTIARVGQLDGKQCQN